MSNLAMIFRGSLNQKRDILQSKSIAQDLTLSEIESLRQDKHNSIVVGREYLKKIKKKIV